MRTSGGRGGVVVGGLGFLFEGFVAVAEDPAGDAADEAEAGGGEVGLGGVLVLRAVEGEDEGGDEEEVAGDDEELGAR